MHRREAGERGQATAFYVGIMVVLFGVVALAIDLGFMFHARRTAQNAADPAALAGAAELEGCGNGDWFGAADNYAKMNLRVTEIDEAAPDSAPAISKASFQIPGSDLSYPSVRVVVERDRAFLFGRFLGLIDQNIRAGAEAVCGPASGAGVCPFGIKAPDPTDLPAPGKDTAYGIQIGKLYAIKVTAQGNESPGNFQILRLITGSTQEAFRDYFANGCEDPDAESAVTVSEGDVLTDTITGVKQGPTIQALDGDGHPITGLYWPEHTAANFPQGHATCNVDFLVDPAGADGVLGTDDDGASGTAQIGGVPTTGKAVITYVDNLTATTACDGIDNSGNQIAGLVHPGVQGRFIQIVLLDDFPNGSSDPAKALGVLRMYIACWDQQDTPGAPAACGGQSPNGNQVWIWGIFGEFKGPDILKAEGLSDNPLAPRHPVLVR